MKFFQKLSNWLLGYGWKANSELAVNAIRVAKNEVRREKRTARQEELLSRIEQIEQELENDYTVLEGMDKRTRVARQLKADIKRKTANRQLLQEKLNTEF